MRKNTLTEFGVRVKKRLVELDMTQKQLAEDVGVAQSYLASILRGRRKGKNHIDPIAKRLDISAEGNDAGTYKSECGS